MKINSKTQRLGFLGLLVSGFLIAALVLTNSRAAANPANDSQTVPERSLRFVHTHTGERLEIVYWRGGQYLPEALGKLDYILRDYRTGDVRHFDPSLYDVLYDLTSSIGHPGGEIDIVCGYRTPKTNEALRAHSNGVAKNSNHMRAMAIDLRMPGIDTFKLRQAALALGRGGVGYYPHSDFIHVDVGRVRQWCFRCEGSRAVGD